MATYLMTWNPKKAVGAGDGFSIARKRLAAGKLVRGNWSTGNRKDIARGDRLFFIRVGIEPKGIFASGFATGDTWVGDHWSDEDKDAYYVDYRYDVCVDFDAGEILSLVQLEKLGDVNWTPQSSGIEIPEATAQKVEAAWEALLGRAGLTPVSPASPPVEEEVGAFAEGHERTAFIKHRHREKKLREAKLAEFKREHGRLFCEVKACGFDFHKVYGEVGANFAEVHHLNQLSITGVTTNTTDALAVLCSNCHRMVHRNGQNRSLDTLIQQTTR